MTNIFRKTGGIVMTFALLLIIAMLFGVENSSAQQTTYKFNVYVEQSLGGGNSVQGTIVPAQPTTSFNCMDSTGQGQTCLKNLTPGTLIKLKAIPAPGFVFMDWEGACVGSGDCELKMIAQDTFVHAFFQKPYKVTVEISGNGAKLSSVADILLPSVRKCFSTQDSGLTCSFDVASGTIMKFKSYPANGTSFNSWSGACTGTGDCDLKMGTENLTIKAIFGNNSVNSSGSASGPSTGNNEQVSSGSASGVQPATNPTSGLENPIKIDSLAGFVKSILDIVIMIGIPVIALAIIYSGFLFVKAQGDPSELETAKKTLLYTIIGAAIVLGSWVLAQAICQTIIQLGNTASQCI